MLKSLKQELNTRCIVTSLVQTQTPNGLRQVRVKKMILSVQVGVCGVSSSTNTWTHEHIHTHSIPCVLCVHFYGVVFYAVIVSPFRWFTFLNAAAAKAIILAWKFANSHIQSFHSGGGGDDNAIGIDVWMLCMLLFMVFSTWFSNKFSLLCKSSSWALKQTHTYVPVRS